MLINLKRLCLSYLSNINRHRLYVFKWQLYQFYDGMEDDELLYCAKTLEDVLLKEEIDALNFHEDFQEECELPDYDKIPRGVPQPTGFSDLFKHHRNAFFKIPQAKDIKKGQVVFISVINRCVRWVIHEDLKQRIQNTKLNYY